jgi:hypothetical protein
VSYIDKSNEFLRNNYSVVILPIILTGCSILFLFFWLFLTLSFYSLATPVEQLNQLPFQHYKIPGLVVALLILSIFYLVWSLFFLMHTAKCIVSGTLISWRFNRKDPYLNASKVYLTSHIGSACLSSFLTALFGLFKFEVDEADVSGPLSSALKNRKTRIDAPAFLVNASGACAAVASTSSSPASTELHSPTSTSAVWPSVNRPSKYSSSSERRRCPGVWWRYCMV